MLDSWLAFYVYSSWCNSRYHSIIIVLQVIDLFRRVNHSLIFVILKQDNQTLCSTLSIFHCIENRFQNIWTTQIKLIWFTKFLRSLTYLETLYMRKHICNEYCVFFRKSRYGNDNTSNSICNVWKCEVKGYILKYTYIQWNPF